MRGPAYLGGVKPQGWRSALTCGCLTTIGVIIVVILIYTLPHIICGSDASKCYIPTTPAVSPP